MVVKALHWERRNRTTAKTCSIEKTIFGKWLFHLSQKIFLRYVPHDTEIKFEGYYMNTSRQKASGNLVLQTPFWCCTKNETVLIYASLANMKKSELFSGFGSRTKMPCSCLSQTPFWCCTRNVIVLIYVWLCNNEKSKPFQVLAVGQKCFARCFLQTPFWCCTNNEIVLIHAWLANMENNEHVSGFGSIAKMFCSCLSQTPFWCWTNNEIVLIHAWLANMENSEHFSGFGSRAEMLCPVSFANSVLVLQKQYLFDSCLFYKYAKRCTFFTSTQSRKNVLPRAGIKNCVL